MSRWRREAARVAGWNGGGIGGGEREPLRHRNIGRIGGSERVVVWLESGVIRCAVFAVWLQ